MVVVAISSILMSVAAPSMVGAYQQYVVTSQANELVNALTQARSEAIRRNIPIRFCRAESESSTTCASSSGEWKYWLLLANTHIVSRGLIRNSGSLKQTANFQSLTFGADGMAYNNQQLLGSAFIQLKAGAKIRCVNLSSGSRTHVTEPEYADDEEEDHSSGASCS